MLFALHLWRRQTVFYRQRAGNFGEIAKSGVIVVGSLSKTFAMTGWRIGYVLAPEPLIGAITKLESQSTTNATSIAQYAALEALRGPMDSVHTMLAEYARRRERILAGLRAIPGITCSAPQGAFYVFPNIAVRLNAQMPTDVHAANLLLERAHVAVVPGTAFGAPGHLRLSYATSIERIEEGQAAWLASLARARVNRPSKYSAMTPRTVAHENRSRAPRSGFLRAPVGLALSRPSVPGNGEPHTSIGESLDDLRTFPLLGGLCRPHTR